MNPKRLPTIADLTPTLEDEWRWGVWLARERKREEWAPMPPKRTLYARITVVLKGRGKPDPPPDELMECQGRDTAPVEIPTKPPFSHSDGV